MKRTFFSIFLILALLLTACSGSVPSTEQNQTVPPGSNIPDDAPFLLATREDFSTDLEWTHYKEGCQEIENGNFAEAADALLLTTCSQKGNESYLYALARLYEGTDNEFLAPHIYDMIVGIRDADVRREALIQDDFEYTELPDGTLSITKYKGSEEYLRIPAQLNGKTVTAIGDNAFKGESSIGVVYLPDTIKTLGKRAFEDCSNLQYINIPEGVTEIPERCFFKTALLEISLPSTLVSIGYLALGSDNLYVFVPEGVTTLGKQAIYGKIAHLPSTITDITEESVKSKTVYHNGSEAVQAAYPSSIEGTPEDAMNHADPVIPRASTVPSPLMAGVWKRLPTDFDAGGEIWMICIVDPNTPAGSVFALTTEYIKKRGGEFIYQKSDSLTLEGAEVRLYSDGYNLEYNLLKYARVLPGLSATPNTK